MSSNIGLVVNPKSGFVGIGTGRPSTLLHVDGNMLAAGTITASNLSILGDFVTLNTITSNTEQMVIQNAGTGPALKVTQTGAHPIADFYDDGQVLAMRIADGGNVGIGTATPRAILDVNGTSAIVLPSGNTLQQPLGISGMARFNTTFDNLEVFKNSYWRPLPAFGIPHDNLAFYVDADELTSYGGSGSSWSDIGQANNLTLVNSPTYTPTKPSYFTFNGTNQSATGQLSNRAGAWSHSVSIWFRLPTVISGSVIFSIGSGEATDQQSSFQIFPTTIRWFFYSDDRDVTITLSANVWYHLCLVYDGGLSDKRLIFVNNVLYNHVTVGSVGTLNIAASALFALGYRRMLPGQYSNCQVANMAIYNKALSKFEISQIYEFYKKRFGY